MRLLNQDLQQSLLKGYISDKNESKLELLPEFLINDSTQNKKVLTTIIRELQDCEEFCSPLHLLLHQELQHL